MDRSQQSREMNEAIDAVNESIRVNNIYGYVFWTWIVLCTVVPIVPIALLMILDLSIQGFFMILIGGAIAIWMAKSVQGRNIESMVERRDRMYEEYKRNRPS